MLGLKSVIFPVCAALCAVAFLYKLLDVRRGSGGNKGRKGRDPALFALLAAFLCKGVSFVLSTPAVSAGVDAFFGVQNLGALGIHLMGGASSSAAFLIAIVHWVHPRDVARARTRVLLTVTALCGLVMIVLWWAGDDGSGQRSQHYLLQNAHRPVTAAYLLLYVTAFGAGMVEIIRLSLRYGKVSGRAWLRRGLHCTAVGAAAYLVYCLNRAWAVVAVQLGLAPLNWEAVTPVANGVGIAFLAAGLTMPSWGPRVSAARQRTDHFLAHQKLHRLWSDLCAANPNIALSPPERSRLVRFAPYDINYRLYRRVIEIQDGILALRPYMPEEPDGVTADTEAALVAAAIDAKMREVELPEAPPTVTSFVPTNVDYAGEVSRLIGVARAYSTLVKQGGTGTGTSTGTGGAAAERWNMGHVRGNRS
ncbi:MAB_1171c family putative transporter [Streptomyces sp. NRRL B-1677]|uniref:MAB_1171c family putative transporter n=1 Tax=Streptomyces sp. NRRL B-1677 TaxID=2682966 RepID=UPI001892B60E|nr:MAB_1171c family putative transporter [Streptomyces sp. NRRL B-1677]